MCRLAESDDDRFLCVPLRAEHVGECVGQSVDPPLGHDSPRAETVEALHSRRVLRQRGRYVLVSHRYLFLSQCSPSQPNTDPTAPAYSVPNTSAFQSACATIGTSSVRVYS